MPTNLALVSIGLPIYNAELYLSQTLDSLLAQDYENFELIISDNASTDATGDICREHARRDKRIRYYRKSKNAGMFENFNDVFRVSKGEYFLWAGGHDLRDKNLISSCMEILLRYPGVVLCSPQFRHIDHQGGLVSISKVSLDTRELDAGERFRRMMREPLFCFAVYSLIRSSALKKTRLFSEAFFSDMILWTELSLNGEFYHTSEASIHMRTFPERDAEEEEDARSKIARLVSPDRAQSISASVMARFPFWQLTLRVLRALYGSNLSLSRKIRLTFSIPREWKANLVRELTTKWLPKSVRRFAKRVVV